MKQINKAIIALIGGVLLSGTIHAQQGTVVEPHQHFFGKNWFVTGAVGEQWLSKTYENIYTARIAGGTWIDKYSGVRLYARSGYSPVSKHANAAYLGGGIDYMLNLLALKEYNPQTRFSLSLLAGVGFDVFDLKNSGLDLNYTHASAMSGNIGVQAGYQFNSHMGVFIEPSLQVLPKYYDKANKDQFIFRSSLSIGVSYYFNRHSYGNQQKECAMQKKNNALEAEVKRVSADTEKLNEEVNLLRKELQQDKQKREGKIVMTAPEKEQLSIDIFFDRFSSFMADEQCRKIDAIGEWMKDNKFDIQIVAFSDNLADKETDQRLRNNRTKAIKEVLMQKYGIGADRIEVVTSESMGYENLTGCNAKILFITTKQKE